MARCRKTVLGVAVLLLGVHSAQAYRVAPALSLERLVAESDVILKARVVASQPIEDEWFEDRGSYRAYATGLKVISVVKGELPGGDVVFQHYGKATEFEGGERIMPQWYELRKGRVYLIFANKTNTPGILRQLWKYHRTKEDQGVVWAADDRPVPKGKPVKEVIWTELVEVLGGSMDSDHIVYALRQMDEMSGGGWHGVAHFDRQKAMAAVALFLSTTDPVAAKRAIRAFGQNSPYFDDSNAAHWLATIGKGSLEGLSLRNKDEKNVTAAGYWKQIVETANGDLPAEICAQAILALGRTKEPALYGHLQKWSDDHRAPIRRAAAILLGDYPGNETRRLLQKLAADDEHTVRSGAARGIGFGQMEELLPLLEQLLGDEQARVRTAAALSIISFGPDKAGAILKAHKDHPDFKSVFVNQLAAKDPEPYLDDLAEIVEKRMEPANFWGGLSPSHQSWSYLYEYLRARPADALRLGEFDKYLDALEASQLRSSSIARKVYAFYIERGLNECAILFREKCKTTFRFDMDTYFNRIDTAHAAKKANR